MKKMFLLAGICLALVSCKNDENDIPDNGVKSECKVSCLLTTTGENPQSFPVYNVPFVFKYEFVNNTITLSTDMLGLSLNNLYINRKRQIFCNRKRTSDYEKRP